MFHILCINDMHKVYQKTNKHTWFYQCNLLPIGHQHVSATRVTIFRMVKTRIQIFKKNQKLNLLFKVWFHGIAYTEDTCGEL
jgi:hypothetical protein